MTIIKDISNTPPSSETLIRIFAAGQLSISKAAADILKLRSDDKIAFVSAKSTSYGVPMVYIVKRESLAYKVIRRGGHYRIHSQSLCDSLAKALNGYGTYRIEPENMETDSLGNRYYPILIRNLKIND